MKRVLADIQNGTFARDWILENQAGQPHFKAMRRIQAEHLHRGGRRRSCAGCSAGSQG